MNQDNNTNFGTSVNLGDNIELEGKRRKGVLALIFTFVLQALLITCILFRGPKSITFAIIALAILSFITWLVAAINLNGSGSERLQKATGYLLGLFIVIDMLTGFLLPSFCSKIITINKDHSIETEYAVKSFDHQTLDGQTVSIPVEHNKVYIENRSATTTLEAHQVYYLNGNLRTDHLNPILISPGEMKQIHDMPTFLFRKVPSTYKETKARNTINHPTGYYTVLTIANQN